MFLDMRMQLLNQALITLNELIPVVELIPLVEPIPAMEPTPLLIQFQQFRFHLNLP